MNIIPTLDLRMFESINPYERAVFVDELKEAFETTGFFFLKNHGIDQMTLSKANRIFDTFFLELSEEQRKKYEYPDEQHQRGYTPPRLEKGEFATIPDEKHFFQIGEDRNVVVNEIENFNLITMQLFCQFKECSLKLLHAISISLGLVKNNSLANKEGNSILRAIEYPATEDTLEDDDIATLGGNIIGMCASKHTDINMITLLEAREEGLQLWYEDTWVSITVEDPTIIIVNAGDMLEHLTGGRYKSGLHRVVCKRNTRRFSIPYFCHLSTDNSIVPLYHLGESDLEKYHFQTVGEYLDFRLKQIGL